MAQAKKKTATKTAKKAAKRTCCKKQATRTSKKQQQQLRNEKLHVYIITAMSMIAGILLFANAAMMIA